MLLRIIGSIMSLICFLPCKKVLLLEYNIDRMCSVLPMYTHIKVAIIYYFLLLMLHEEHAPGPELTSSPNPQCPQKHALEDSQKALSMDHS